MEITIRKYEDSDIPVMVKIWNRVVEDANAFPQTEKLSEEQAKEFFSAHFYGSCNSR